MSKTIVEDVLVKLSEVPAGESFQIFPDKTRNYIRLFPSPFLNGASDKIYSDFYGHIVEHEADLSVVIEKVYKE